MKQNTTTSPRSNSPANTKAKPKTVAHDQPLMEALHDRIQAKLDELRVDFKNLETNLRKDFKQLETDLHDAQKDRIEGFDPCEIFLSTQRGPIRNGAEED